MNKVTINERENIDLVDYDIMGIQAKIDTGAYYGAIHCSNVELIEKDGKRYVSFYLLDDKHPKYNKQSITARISKRVYIANSFGEGQWRYMVKLKIMLRDEQYEVYFSLADRSKMAVPVLLGRHFLQGKFLVDVSAQSNEGEKTE